MNLLLALGGAAASVGSFVLLIQNVSGPCTAVLSLLYSVAFVPCSVAAAYGLKNLLAKK